MAKPVARSVVEGFYRALAGADFTALEPYLADNVTWTISGPVDILPYCGLRRGKAVVLRWLDRDIPAFLDKRVLVPDVMLVEGDRVAVFGQLTARRRDLGHAISYRIAQFVRFEHGKAVEYVSIIDSFDAVEQVLAHPLAVPGGAGQTSGERLAV
jgi:ketosteroid isomerase-like protein